MSGTTTDSIGKTQTNPPRPIGMTPGESGLFELGARAERLEASDEYRRSGVAGATLVRDDAMTLVLVALREGATMREHKAPSAGAVVLLSGRAVFVSDAGDAGGDERELAPGSLAVFSADLVHAVRALEDARYLVVIGGRSRPQPGTRDGAGTVTGSEPAGSGTGTVSVTELLGLDHQRIDAFLIEARRSLAAEDRAQAARRLDELASALERHMSAEEEILFPAFQAHAGARGTGPVEVMRHEHTQLRGRIAELRSVLEAGPPDGAARLFAHVTALLAAHNGKEERILYPATDHAARDAGTLGELVARLREALEP
ncbi:MAG TPA: hypothetical protein ENO23_02535 [Alphaproteobacteria bacterium]|nr:hypothetical protein [Alphaproteobacteria bacterium]